MLKLQTFGSLFSVPDGVPCSWILRVPLLLWLLAAATDIGASTDRATSERTANQPRNLNEMCRRLGERRPFIRIDSLLAAATM